MLHLRLAIAFLAIPGFAQAEGAPATLLDGALAFAGRPVLVDSRLGTRSCLPGGFRYGWAGPAVEARCPATGERLVLPLATDAPDTRLKRGESVQADYVGAGFRLSVGAVADANGRDGRVMLRNSRSGTRFAARMDHSGRIIVSNSAD